MRGGLRFAVATVAATIGAHAGCQLVEGLPSVELEAPSGTGGGSGGASHATSSSSSQASGTGGSVDTCDGGAMACKSAMDCGMPATACLVPTCSDGYCGTMPASKGTACIDNGGKVCDGSGTCVGCNDNGDCGACA